ncbi:MAG: 1-deoxy-D-xylulose-5-phosphate synthase, partial [Clostridiales bacterium]|nr:1-deoxy-D-xylulose-5-phosphate synthase [Clostridiales bacterium]
LCVDRAGVVGSDGMTHQGVFDLSYLSLMPNMTVICPTDGNELRAALEFSLAFDSPLAIRYPKSYSTERDHSPFVYGQWEVLHESKSKVYVLCVGGRALDVAYSALGDVEINIVNARFAKPLDEALLLKINKSGNTVITVEDNAERGGFGTSVLAFLNSCDDSKKANCVIIAHGDEFIDDREVSSSLALSGISKEKLIKTVKSLE